MIGLVLLVWGGGDCKSVSCLPIPRKNSGPFLVFHQKNCWRQCAQCQRRGGPWLSERLGLSLCWRSWAPSTAPDRNPSGLGYLTPRSGPLSISFVLQKHEKTKGGRRFFFSGRFPWAWDLFSMFPVFQCPSDSMSSWSQLSGKACPSPSLLRNGFGETSEVCMTLRASVTVHISMYLSNSEWAFWLYFLF